jgi:arylsulfatase A-like enzyme
MNGRMDGHPPDTVIHTGVTTTSDVLRELGYATAHYGKWHVGRSDPKANGFDDSDGPNSNQGPDRGATPNHEQTAMITDKGIAFMCAVLVEMGVADNTYIFFSADYGAQVGRGEKKKQQGSNP